jgi:MOSC domain-containing protein YiiM
VLNPDSPLQRLLDGPMRPGTVEWIGLRPARHAPMLVVTEAALHTFTGVDGDHYGGSGGARQVSLIGQDNLRAIASFLGREAVAPELLRRNFVVRGANLLALKGRRFHLGGALLEYTGKCHPCSRMIELLGPYGYNAVRGQGGVLARVLLGGAVRVGDNLSRLEPLDESFDIA